MKDKLKKILIKLGILNYLKTVKKSYQSYNRDFSNRNRKKSIFKVIKEIKIYDIDKNVNNLYKLIDNLNIIINDEGYIYFIDTNKYISTDRSIFGNLTIDYSIVLDKSLEELFSEYEIKECLVRNINAIIEKIKKSDRSDKEKMILFFNNILFGKVESFEEALQRILWYNQILWQTGHTLMGLGRLDKILNSYYKSDISKGVINKEKAELLILDFLNKLHENYWFKSQALMGDTGQIIILGGLNRDGSYFCNELTYLFIDCVKQLNLPDPKTLLRVSKNMPDDLLRQALISIKTGIGCPLFSNDDQIIERLIKIGIDEDDAYNYVTSACWEPLIPRKSVAQNNVATITFIKPFIEMMDNEDISCFDNIDSIIEKYQIYLKKYINNVIDNFEKVEYVSDELLSALTDNCNKNKIDISRGGAKYNNIGLTSVSMANLVESIINIETLVFDEKKYTLNELNDLRKSNFEGNNEVVELLKNYGKKYGDNDEKVISYTNKITDIANSIILKRKTKYGGIYKFGLSAPSYIDEARDCKASFDGRKDYEPFSVHISSTKGNFIELFQFASKINYDDCRINGNVVDIVVSPSMLEDNFEKFLLFLKVNIEIGFYQMQMNVVSSEVLIRAKENPELFPNLIVRVWGFSAYFNDLPEEYKDLIIERTLKSEGM